MKSVLLSIKPKFCELIASGEKTVEIRKNCPKIDVPFKCYIYCTKGKDKLLDVIHKGEDWGWGYGKVEKTTFIKAPDIKIEYLHWRGKVIGEFVCDDIDKIAVFNNILYCVNNTQANKLKQACLTIEDIKAYLGFKNSGYAWHISDLVIYDKPKELSEFLKYNRTEDDCYCQHLRKPNSCRECMRCALERPPQNWCYVEELEETT